MKVSKIDQQTLDKYIGDNNKVPHQPSKVQEVLAKYPALKIDFKDLTEEERLIIRIHLQRVAFEKLLKSLL